MLTSIACQGGACQVDHMSGRHNKKDSIVHEGGQIGQVALVGQALQGMRRYVRTPDLAQGNSHASELLHPGPVQPQMGNTQIALCDWHMRSMHHYTVTFSPNAHALIRQGTSPLSGQLQTPHANIASAHSECRGYLQVEDSCRYDDVCTCCHQGEEQTNDWVLKVDCRPT